MEEFRKEFKEKNPKNNSVAADKAPYVAKANKLKAEYNKAIAAYNRGESTAATKKAPAKEEDEEESDKSEVNDKDDDEGSEELMDLPGPRWKKGKDGKDFAALAAANPMSSIVIKLQASLSQYQPVAILSNQGGDAVLGVTPDQAALLNRAAFGRAVEISGKDRQWFQLGSEEVFFLCHVLKCISVESADKKQMDKEELWDHLSSTSESFPEMYKAYQHLRLKNWVVRFGLQYGADFVAYRHHPALVHSEFAVIIVPEGNVFGARCGRMKVWSDLLCALRVSGSVAKTLLILTISSRTSELTSSDCLQQMIVHERTITRWIPQQCREQQHKLCREEAKLCREEDNMVEQEYTIECSV